jgi:CheY-like chemotaxis protein
MPTILLVDDNKDYREGIAELLESYDYSVIQAWNGTVALSLIHQSKPDLIISNGNMPVMDGIELLRALKADEQLKTIPFIMVTGRSESSFGDAARTLGADAVILKPIGIEELLALLRKLLKT